MIADDYLVMARVLDREFEKWVSEHNHAWRDLTGLAQLYVERAYTDAFMAGFYLKFTKEDERN